MPVAMEDNSVYHSQQMSTHLMHTTPSAGVPYNTYTLDLVPPGPNYFTLFYFIKILYRAVVFCTLVNTQQLLPAFSKFMAQSNKIYRYLTTASGDASSRLQDSSFTWKFSVLLPLFWRGCFFIRKGTYYLDNCYRVESVISI